jgi:hypothetical protein
VGAYRANERGFICITLSNVQQATCPAITADKVAWGMEHSDELMLTYAMYLENTGASVVNPWGDQKPLVVQSVKGFSMPSSRTRAKMLWYCRRGR